MCQTRCCSRLQAPHVRTSQCQQPACCVACGDADLFAARAEPDAQRALGSAIVLHGGQEIAPPTWARVPGPCATAIRAAADRAVVAVLHLVGCNACGPTAAQSDASCLVEGNALQQQKREHERAPTGCFAVPTSTSKIRAPQHTQLLSNRPRAPGGC